MDFFFDTNIASTFAGLVTGLEKIGLGECYLAVVEDFERIGAAWGSIFVGIFGFLDRNG